MIGRRTASDIAIAAGIFAFAFLLGSFVATHFAGQPRFYQEEFGPAVMVAAGHGFVNPSAAPGSAVAGFLAQRRATINTSDVSGTAGEPLNQFQQATRYLLLSVGYVWRLSGISWAAVSVVSAVLCGLTVAACYVIFRLWFSTPLAIFGAAVFAMSPLHLAQLPHVRDYSKAPFILLALALTAVVSLRPLSRRMLVALSVACGVVVGVGLGFKMDVVIMAPVFLASLVAFRGQRPWRDVGDKSLAGVAFVLALMIAAAPVLLHLSTGGSNGYHAILLGDADPFDASLGVTRPLYSVFPVYDDVYVAAAVKDYGWRRTGEMPGEPSTAYDAAGRAYWLSVIRHFPADTLIRALGSTNAILNLPFDNPALNFLTPPASRANPVWNVLTNQPPHRLRLGAMFERLSIVNGGGVLLGVLLIAAAAAQTTRLGLFAAAMTLGLPGYASLQFADRHFFHLELIPVIGLLVAIDIVIHRRWSGARVVRRFAVAAGTLAVVLTASVVSLRAYQADHLKGVFQRYVDARRESVPAVLTESLSGTWRATWSAAGNPAPYYLVEFDGAPGRELEPVEIRYKSTPAVANYSRVVFMPQTAGVNRVFVPGYAGEPQWAFEGIEMPARVKARLRGIYRIELPDPQAPLFELHLAGDWRDRRLYQSLRVERPYEPDALRWYGGVSDKGLSRIAWSDQFGAPDATPDANAVATAYTPASRITGAGIEMDGRADTQSSYLLEFKPVKVTTTGALLVKGHLETGGVSIGVLENGQWHGQVTINEPGDFVAVVEIERAGSFVPIVTNATRRDHDRNIFTLTRFGVVTLERTARVQ